MPKVNHSKLIWGLRILFCLFFLLSAFSKVYPKPDIAIHLFEKGQFLTLGIPLCTSTWLSRLLISLEFTIAVGFIIPFFFRRITLPVSILVLIFFTLYLSYEVLILGKKDGNCGCFGQLIPMTPPVSLIKNIIALVPLFYIFYKRVNIIERSKPIFIFFFGYILVFITLLIISPKVCFGKKEETIVKQKLSPEINTLLKDFPSITEGKQVLCYFSPTCSHCMKTAETLNKLKSKTGLEKHFIVFMNESDVETKIKKFISSTGIKADYKVIEFIDFPSDTDPPAVLVLDDGIIKARFFGKDEHKFDKSKFLKWFK